jgi:hypothetical protein
MASPVGPDDANSLSTFPEQEISAKHFLPVNLRGAFDMVAAISAQGSHFEPFAQLRDQFRSLNR